MPSSYKYQPLSSPTTQIRLLELLPGRGILQCRLKVVDLREAEGTYEPISYCWKAYTRKHWWGTTYKEKNKQKKFRMRVDGADLDITESLRAALQRVRLKTESRLLWADAACINQEDDNEKGAQVVMMGSIYQNGKQTIVWLGKSDCLTGRVFRYLEEMPYMGPKASDKSEVSEEPTGQRLNSTAGLAAAMHRMKQMGYELLLLRSGSSLLSRPYFNRAWIVQEVVLSNHTLFLCGKHEITWDALCDAICAGEAYLPWRASLLGHSMWDLWDNKGFYCLDTILSKVSHTETSEPRDKLYSALGLHQDWLDGVSVRVDYSKDVDEVFLEATRLLLSQSSSLNLLSMSHGANRSKGKHIPSWVWNPQCGSTEYHLSWAAADRTTPFSASRGWIPRPHFQNRRIGLLGYVFNKVNAVGRRLPVHPGYWTHSLLLEAMRSYFSWVDVSRMYEQGITEREAKRRMRAFRCTLAPLEELHDAPEIWYSNLDNVEEERSFEIFHEEMMKMFSKFFPRGEAEASVRERLAFWADTGLLFLRLTVGPSIDHPRYRFVAHPNIRAIFDRCFMRTETGDYGLCPPSTKPDDRLVLLQGASVPIVLRPSGENWILVGECYMYGVMFGELWDQDRCEMLWIE